MAKQAKATTKKTTRRKLPVVRGDQEGCSAADIVELRGRIETLEAIVRAVTGAPSGSFFTCEDGVLVTVEPPHTGVKRPVWNATIPGWEWVAE